MCHLIPNSNRRGDDHKRSLPPWPETIKTVEVWPAVSPLQHQKLLAQGQIFEEEIARRTKKASKQTHQKPKHDILITASAPALSVEAVEIRTDQNFGEPQ